MLTSIADKIGKTEVGISVVTLIELAHGAAHANTSERRAIRQNFIAELLTAMPISTLSRCLSRFAPVSSTAKTKHEEYEFRFPIF
jgi:hypothetical protein